ncbi:hypothetical protein L204_104090 [Cryptococcus depauperatus]|nr:palmitoyl-protein thioesterase [Cryptococcus depauperatus CBS 7855]
MLISTSPILALTAFALQALSTTAINQVVLAPGNNSPRPLVIWHGLGDTALSPGIQDFIERIRSIHPGIYVHSVQIPRDGSLDDERKAGFWGNAGSQGDQGCEQIKEISELSQGFDGMGFSQGGLFLRHYHQYCDGPPIHNLITFGTPHYGIAALIPCPTPPTLSCLLAARAARGAIYTFWAQSHLIQAAYFRDTNRLEEFYGANEFIRDLNGEEPFSKNSSKGKMRGNRGEGRGLADLDNLVAIMFDADHTVSPAQSAHFATFAPNNKTQIISIDHQPLYQHDWIGLKALDKKKGLKLEHCPGEHMDLGGEGGCGERMVRDWVGW